MGLCPWALATSLVPGESSIGLDTVGYLHSSDEAPLGFQNAVTPRLIGKWSGTSQGAVGEVGAQAELLLMFSNASRGSAKPSTYFELPEFYVGTSKELFPVQLHVGRRLENWSHLDEMWQLGIWQPRFRWDYLHPDTVGLGGAFLTVDQPLFRLVAWGSPVSIPERGVAMENCDDSFCSDSRWFIPPPSMIMLYGQSTQAHYTADVPPLTDLVMNAGASVMARVGGETGPWGSVGYAYKPMNQLRLAMNGMLQLSATRPIYGDAVIYPRIAYHHLTSMEAGYGSEPFNAWVSMLTERPVPGDTPIQWTTQELTPALSVSSSIDFRVAGTPKRPTRLELSYLREWGGNSPDKGPQADPGEPSKFEARYPFQHAAALGVRSQLFSATSASTRVLYDIGHVGAVWSTELRIKATSAWVVEVGADFLTSHPTISDSENADLIGRFRANDRVHAGVTYVF